MSVKSRAPFGVLFMTIMSLCEWLTWLLGWHTHDFDEDTGEIQWWRSLKTHTSICAQVDISYGMDGIDLYFEYQEGLSLSKRSVMKHNTKITHKGIEWRRTVTRIPSKEKSSHAEEIFVFLPREWFFVRNSCQSAIHTTQSWLNFFQKCKALSSILSCKNCYCVTHFATFSLCLESAWERRR